MKMMQVDDSKSIYCYRLDWLITQIFRIYPAKGKKAAYCELTLRFACPTFDQNGKPFFSMEWAGDFDSVEAARASISIIEY